MVEQNFVKFNKSETVFKMEKLNCVKCLYFYLSFKARSHCDYNDI